MLANVFENMISHLGKSCNVYGDCVDYKRPLMCLLMVQRLLDNPENLAALKTSFRLGKWYIRVPRMELDRI